MIKTGIVGISGSKEYIQVIEGHNGFLLTGVYDPGFQNELVGPAYLFPVFYNYTDFLKKCDVVIFASADKLIYNLVVEAIKLSKQVYLSGCYNFSPNEIRYLINLATEANETIQVGHPFFASSLFSFYTDKNIAPYLIEIRKKIIDNKKIINAVRAQISAIFMMQRSGVRKVNCNSLAIFNQLPDFIDVRIDFDNGTYAKVMVDAVGQTIEHQIQVFGYNSIHNLNFVDNNYIETINGQNYINNFYCTNNNIIAGIEQQIHAFYLNILHFRQPQSNLFIELQTQQVIEKVKEKIKVCFNIF